MFKRFQSLVNRLFKPQPVVEPPAKPKRMKTAPAITQPQVMTEFRPLKDMR